MRVEAIQPVLSSRGPGRGSGAAARVHVKVRWRFRGRVGFRDAVRAKVVPPGLSGARLRTGTGLLGVQVPHRIAGGASRTRAAGGWME